MSDARRLPFICAAVLSAIVWSAESPPDSAGAAPSSQWAETFRQRRAHVRSVVARMRAVVHDEKLNQQFTLDGAAIADLDGHARLRLTAESGQLLLDWAVSGERVDVCVPVKECIYSGTRAELSADAPSAVRFLARCANLFELFFPKLERASVAARIGGLVYCNTPTERGPLPRMERCICASVNDSAMVLKALELFDSGGIAAGRIEFGEYDRQTPALPRALTLHPPGGRYRIELTLEDVTLNTTVPPAKFVLPASPGFRRANFAEALRKDFKPLE